MKKILIVFLLFIVCATQVKAMEVTAPPAPDAAQELLPGETTTFGEDLWYIIKQAISKVHPDVSEAMSVCAALIGILLLVSVVRSYATMSERTAELVGTLSVAILLVRPTNAFIHLGIETIQMLCEYGKLLLPVMTTALAAEGGVSTATGLYTGTVFFNTILSAGISKLIVPMVYIFIALSVACNALGEDLLKKLQSFVKWLMTWSLKIVLYLFTGFLGITGVISGTVDATTVKAAKLALSGVVPVVGGIISDASEAVLVSAGVLKNAAGIYGILAMIAVGVLPFLRIGIQYLLLKLCGAVCGVFGTKSSVGLAEDFTSVMGMLLAMTGSVCLLHIISTVCFMKGVN